jgi:hypothetical protein
MVTLLTPDLLNEARRAIRFGHANHHDMIVLNKLERAAPLSLAVDEFAGLLSKKSEGPNDERILALRDGLKTVYLEAARVRREAGAAKKQVRIASKALNHFTKGLELIDEARPPGRRWLNYVKGADESNDFDDAC